MYASFLNFNMKIPKYLCDKSVSTFLKAKLAELRGKADQDDG